MTTGISTSIGAVALTSLALAACGGGEGEDPSSPANARERFQEAALKHAECMRRNGIDVPDPKPGGGIIINDSEEDPEKVRQAEEKCRKYLEDLPAPELSPEDEREFRERALAQARCLREHGIDMPDPKFGPNGRVQMELSGEIPIDDPRFQEADKECREESGMGGAIGVGRGPGG